MKTGSKTLSALLAMSAALGACADDDPSHSADAKGNLSAAEKECEELGEADCSANTSCRSLAGVQYDPQNSCRLSKAAVFVGCAALATGCTASIVHATDPKGDAWELTSGCIPEGWAEIESTKAPATVSSWNECPAAAQDAPKSCDSIAATNCAATAGCRTIEGVAYDGTQSCRDESPSVIACASATLGCTASVVHARNSQGETFEISSGCVPTGWTAIESAAAPATVSGWAVCSTTKCDALNVDACASAADCRVLEGFKYDAAHQCRAAMASGAACAPKSRGCTASVVHAADQKGATWEFAGGCVPTGWTEVEAPVEPFAWPACAQ